VCGHRHEIRSIRLQVLFRHLASQTSSRLVAITGRPCRGPQHKTMMNYRCAANYLIRCSRLPSSTLPTPPAASLAMASARRARGTGATRRGGAWVTLPAREFSRNAPIDARCLLAGASGDGGVTIAFFGGSGAPSAARRLLQPSQEVPLDYLKLLLMLG